MRAGNFLWSILAALATGTILGILFAPDKGSNTRMKISNKSREFTDDLEAKYDDLVSGVNKKMEAFKKEADRMATEVKAKSEETMANYNAKEKAKMN